MEAEGRGSLASGTDWDDVGGKLGQFVRGWVPESRVIFGRGHF